MISKDNSIQNKKSSHTNKNKKFVDPNQLSFDTLALQPLKTQESVTNFIAPKAPFARLKFWSLLGRILIIALTVFPIMQILSGTKTLNAGLIETTLNIKNYEAHKDFVNLKIQNLPNSWLAKVLLSLGIIAATALVAYIYKDRINKDALKPELSSQVNINNCVSCVFVLGKSSGP